jgi:hypothetical protein
MKKEVHSYDTKTGVYIKTYPCLYEAESDLGLYRGAATDILRRGGKHSKTYLSYQKTDIFPTINNEIFKVQTTEIKMFSETELRQKHDMFFMLIAYVNNIPKGKFIDEVTLLRQLELLGKPRYRDAVSRPELKQFRGKVDGVIYYGCEESISKLKHEGVLQ